MDTILGGRKFELDVFGFSSSDEGRLNCGRYHTFMTCMNKSIIQRKKEGWDHKKSFNPPENLLISKLFYKIREIGKSSEAIPFTVKVYPMVGTIIDYHHSVDGIITARSPDKKRKALVPFDITINPCKTPKPEVLVLRPPHFTDENLLEYTAQLFVRIIQRQLSSNEQ